MMAQTAMATKNKYMRDCLLCCATLRKNFLNVLALALGLVQNGTFTTRWGCPICEFAPNGKVAKRDKVSVSVLRGVDTKVVSTIRIDGTLLLHPQQSQRGYKIVGKATNGIMGNYELVPSLPASGLPTLSNNLLKVTTIHEMLAMGISRIYTRVSFRTSVNFVPTIATMLIQGVKILHHFHVQKWCRFCTPFSFARGTKSINTLATMYLWIPNHFSFGCSIILGFCSTILKLGCSRIKVSSCNFERKKDALK